MNIDLEEYYNSIIYPWTIEKKIGEGGSGIVYRIGQPENPKKQIALKVICFPKDIKEIEQKEDEGYSKEEISLYYERAADEIVGTINRVRALEKCANLLKYSKPVKRVRKDGMAWDVLVAMELLIPFDNYVKEREQLSVQEVINLGIDICNALEVCHGRMMLHRDIKPANILVTSNGRFKLGDFGIARVKEKTITTAIPLGTPVYIAPEIEKGERIEKNDFRSDIFSLGVLLFQQLNDNRPPSFPDYPAMRNINDNRIWTQHKIEGSLELRAKTYEGPLMDVVKKATMSNPRNRFQSISEMKVALEKLNSIDCKLDIVKPLSATKIVKFGIYPQSKVNGDDYKDESIRWIVLEERSDSMLLMSEKVIDCKAFYPSRTRVEWKNSTLRSWLNGYGEDANDYGEDYKKDNFIDKAFSRAEKSKLGRIDGDMVSLLKWEEVFGIKGDSYGFSSYRTAMDLKRIAFATDYAVDRNVYTHSKSGISIWWLRSRSEIKKRVMFVDYHGRVACNGAYVSDDSIGIRPVILLRK